MAYIGGGYYSPGETIDLVPLDPLTHPVPSCLLKKKPYARNPKETEARLKDFPFKVHKAAGALMWPGKKPRL